MPDRGDSEKVEANPVYRCTQPALSLQNYSFTYAGSELPVLQQINFELNFGEFMLLSGHSGEGKSTLLSAINGAIPHFIHGSWQGRVLVNNQDISNLSMARRAALVGSVLQNADHQIVHAVVEDEIAFGCENLQMAPEQIGQQIEKVCRLLQLNTQDRTKTLSGGQKQRLISASTLAMGQKILVFDEPLANLDRTGAHILLDALKKLTRQQYAVLFIEHRLDLVMPYADKFGWLSNGRLTVSSERKTFSDKQYLHNLASSFVEINDSTDTQQKPETTAIKMKNKSDIRVQRKKHNWLIQAEQVQYQIGQQIILKDISFELYRGDCLVLLGDNGSGKTTLLQLLAHLLQPTGGRINQAILPDKKDKAGTSAWYKKVGYVYQDPSYQLFMPSVEEEIAYQSENRTNTQMYLRRYTLEQVVDIHPQRLSEGQKRRVSIAAVHAVNPAVLLLDEPTVGQDTRHLDQMIAIWQKWLLFEQGTMVMVTHDYRCAFALASRVIWLEDGRIYKAGGRELLSEYFE